MPSWRHACKSPGALENSTAGLTDLGGHCIACIKDIPGFLQIVLRRECWAHQSSTRVGVFPVIPLHPGSGALCNCPVHISSLVTPLHWWGVAPPNCSVHIVHLFHHTNVVGILTVLFAYAVQLLQGTNVAELFLNDPFTSPTSYSSTVLGQSSS